MLMLSNLGQNYSVKPRLPRHQTVTMEGMNASCLVCKCESDMRSVEKPWVYTIYTKSFLSIIPRP